MNPKEPVLKKNGVTLHPLQCQGNGLFLQAVRACFRLARLSLAFLVRLSSSSWFQTMQATA